MFIKRTLLSTALLAAAMQVQAGNDDSGFIADSHLNANLRTFYFNRDKIGTADSEALAQALRLDFTSGYASDLIGFDASLFTSQKLSGDDGEGGTGLLRTKSDGSQGGYTKIGQAYLKLKLGESANLKAGRMVLDTPLFNDSDSRATPSSTQAIIAEADISGARIYGIWSDKAADKTDEDFENYTDNQGNDYEVIVIGGGYDFDNGLAVKLAYGEADNVMTQTYLNASLPIKISEKMTVELDGHYYMGEADGAGALSSVGEDYDSDLVNLAARLVYEKMKVTLSYQAVDGDEYEESWDGFSNDDTGLSTWNSVQRLDFDRAEEQSWQVRFDYAFTSVPGLTFMTRYTRGDNIQRSDNTEGKEWERNIELKYNFQELDGLSLRWRNSTVRSTETVDTNENRLILNYNVAVF
ncbi:OprD family outer membrane porin [Motiliproteus sp. MSK22-1]|uniref:OprD family outer membrane porin n=1 Tax=Motiliproteus sp. MSK22-1 TaxID=1897630 RepID=UPI000975FEB5|nr:OprD family outer membrane porin [Motiliproteus sp. MSK22-1]OMH38212.1 hypothetical protein BGP75_08135 [Motiliproteus sp. MSK22-1]